MFGEKSEAAENRANAIEAENVEHNMTVLQAVKAYPMASFWAFIMSFTIVSSLSISPALNNTQLIPPDHGVL